MSALPQTVFSRLPTTIFERMSRLAEAHQAVNLGQGFPDGAGPASVIDEAVRALREESQQYPSMLGLPRLREAIAAHERETWGLVRDPLREVLVTSGATEALAATLLTMLGPGDEVLVLEPTYDCYVPMIQRAGAVPIFVRLGSPDFRIDREALEKRVTSRTRAILVNSPHNPTGRVFDRQERAAVLSLADRHGLWIIEDAVYEHLVFEPASYEPLAAARPERTIKIGSAGKIFSMTGWKVGWLTAPAAVASLIAKAHQYLTFTTPPNLQHAVALGLQTERAWVAGETVALAEKRDRLQEGLEAVGLKVLPSEGTYFLSVDLTETPWEGRDEAYAIDLTERCGVTTIPLSAFYAEDPHRSAVRFCFAKRVGVLDEALLRLRERGALGPSVGPSVGPR